jgi:Ser/Thr protein kinase RdoA (MazF antagonist)
MRYLPLPRSADAFQQAPSAAQIAAFASRLLGAEQADAVVEAVELGVGAFNNTFRLNAADGRRRVLRVSPPHDHRLLFHVEHHLLRREHALAPWLAAAGPLLPRVVAADFTGEVAPRDAVLSEYVEGENWDTVRDMLTPAQEAMLWRELAGLLRRVHATRAPRFGWPGAAADDAGERGRWSEFVLGNIRGLLADLSRLGLRDEEARAWAAVAEGCAPALDEIAEPRVLHGDPWPKNVLIRREPGGGEARIVALLDHERGLFGDPLAEWVFEGCDFPPVFWEAYGGRPVDRAARVRAAIYRGTIDIQCLLEEARYPGWDASVHRRRLAEEAVSLAGLWGRR